MHQERAMPSDCLFCRIIAGELPAAQVYSDDAVVAIRDVAPQAPTHILLLSRKHIASAREIGEEDRDLVGRICAAGTELATREGIADDGYRLVVNVGRQGGQTVAHLHVHLLGGRPMAWPPG
jgi:histidine triad (HIT) family protein